MVKNKIPKIISTGGLLLPEIDKIIRLMKKYNQNFALMHCISLYPSDETDLQLSFIKSMKKRYPDIPIGWSTHEDPDSLLPSSLAKACGAELFERHIGIQTIKHKLNAYSMNIVQTEEWIKTIVNSKKLLGNKGIKKINIEEKQSIMELQRGVFLKSKISKGKKITKNDIYFAFPLQSNQISSGEFTEGLKATRDYKINEPLKENIKIKESKNIRKIIHSFKGMFSEAAVVIGDYQFIELSHHYGIKRFNKFGCILITIFNKSYCKKLVGVLPGQSHPSHRHIKKMSLSIF